MVLKRRTVRCRGRFEVMGSGFDPAAGAGSGEEGLVCFMEADIGRPLEYGLELFGGKWKYRAGDLCAE